MRRVFFAGVAAVAYSGCTLLVDTDGLSGGPLTAPSPDGGHDGAADVVAFDAGSDASGPTLACPPDAILCEDFESGFGKFEQHTDNGTIELATDIVHSGKQAFRSRSLPHASSGSNQAELRFGLPLALEAGTTVYFRAYVYLPATLAPDTTISKWRTTTDDDINLKLDPNGHFKVDADVADAGPELSGIDVAPIGKWLCVDWRATLGTPGHELLSVDGVTQIDKDENNVPPGGYVEIGFGFVAGDPAKDMTVLFDDVIVSASPVGCP